MMKIILFNIALFAACYAVGVFVFLDLYWPLVATKMERVFFGWGWVTLVGCSLVVATRPECPTPPAAPDNKKKDE